MVIHNITNRIIITEMIKKAYWIFSYNMAKITTIINDSKNHEMTNISN